MENINRHYYKKIPYGSGILVHCPNCEAEGEPSYRLGGYNWLNIVLLLLGILPGVFYYIWRRSNCVCLCKNCHKERLGEINGDDELIKKLKKITCIQNICYILLILFFFLFVGYEIIFYL